MAGQLTAIVEAGGRTVEVASDTGDFAVEGISGPATVVIRDAHGNTSAPTPVG